MGQYYICVFLAHDLSTISAMISASNHGCGVKLMEHAYVRSQYMNAVEFLLSRHGPHYKRNIVWAGDYADPEPGSEHNLYSIASEEMYAYKETDPRVLGRLEPRYDFVVNHTKGEYVDTYQKIVHPLPLLTSEGCGRGGGDYRGKSEYVGYWARDQISVEKTPPRGYKELKTDFEDDMN